MDLDEVKAGVGLTVKYRPYQGAEWEYGVITGSSRTHAFVRYENDRGELGQPKATKPEDLVPMGRNGGD